jgi:nucleotidyltransferase/DNA polymerase involved in DNA repair
MLAAASGEMPFVITPKMGPALVENLPVGKFHGVGPATTAKMNRLGIETDLDLRAQTLPFLQGHFGKSGSYYYWIARGIDDRPVRANRVRKSVPRLQTLSTKFRLQQRSGESAVGFMRHYYDVYSLLQRQDVTDSSAASPTRRTKRSDFAVPTIRTSRKTRRSSRAPLKRVKPTIKPTWPEAPSIMATGQHSRRLSTQSVPGSTSCDRFRQRHRNAADRTFAHRRTTPRTRVVASILIFRLGYQRFRVRHEQGLIGVVCATC